MRIILANPRGFCAGVNMAIESLDRALELFGTPLYVYHEIVHNRPVVERFSRRGVVFVDDVSEIPEGATVLYSAHGVAPALRRAANERRLRAIDATCPLVTKVHLEAVRFAQQGYTIILIGHEGHDEVVGTMGEAPQSMLLVQDVSDVASLGLPADAKLAYLTQTTLSVDDAEVIIAALRRRFPQIEGPSRDDICYATQNRQEAVKELMPEVDIVLVLGSQNSSNSMRLAEIAQSCGKTAHLIDSFREIGDNWLGGSETVLITAGASAPEDVVEECVEYLRQRFGATVESRTVREEHVSFPLPRELQCSPDDVKARRKGALMSAPTLDLSLDYLPRLPRRKDYRIGCIGAGFIMRDCHLVAYRQAGLNPVAIASRDPAHAHEAATARGVPHCHGTITDLLSDQEIEVLDIAVPPDVQPAIIRAAAGHAGHIRGILAQKPLAMSYREAKDCVELCAKAGIKLAVNQNMRYDQSVRALKDILRRGWLGEPVLGTIEMRAIPHWMPWSEGLPSLSTFIMSIHHLDTFRYWFGTPDRVLASTRPDPRTRFAHRDGINLYILEYDNGCRAAAWDDVWTGPAREGAESDIYIKWRVEGTEGLARGTIGWPNYPARTPSTLDFTTSRHPGYWFQPRWQEVWFPDAFVGTMAQLLCALEDDTEPEISGRDNLDTIALCEAVFMAGLDHRVISIRERAP